MGKEISEELERRAGKLCESGGKISVGLFQDELSLSYSEAKLCVKRLVADGVLCESGAFGTLTFIPQEERTLCGHGGDKSKGNNEGGKDEKRDEKERADPEEEREIIGYLFQNPNFYEGELFVNDGSEKVSLLLSLDPKIEDLKKCYAITEGGDNDDLNFKQFFKMRKDEIARSTTQARKDEVGKMSIEQLLKKRRDRLRKIANDLLFDSVSDNNTGNADGTGNTCTADSTGNTANVGNTDSTGNPENAGKADGKLSKLNLIGKRDEIPCAVINKEELAAFDISKSLENMLAVNSSEKRSIVAIEYGGDKVYVNVKKEGSHIKISDSSFTMKYLAAKYDFASEKVAKAINKITAHFGVTMQSVGESIIFLVKTVGACDELQEEFSRFCACILALLNISLLLDDGDGN